ncbi:MAG: tRNA uridine-5-carboxymethylaminomethyl(34) synthesis GTPase MnmE [Clostridia bacterium]|nr:tRNA uridine-5-carboxymethylaminomethyl(34) synthesis GTPase MnmE [Clostridia bacterium]
MSIGETIAAVSTPRGTGGVAVIRISGDGVRGVLDGVFTPAGGGSLFDRPARTATYGAVKDAAGATVDRAVATFFEGPNSFTGEDVGEICCHGGVAVTASVLSAVLAAGASQAGPGEFTRRAFINGKMTLTEAEATGLLISADTPERMKLAGAAADGVLSRKISSVTEKLRAALASLCAVIDYPDELVADENIDPEGEILSAVRGARKDTEKILATYKRGSAVVGGVRTVICGAPNVGKSSLFNALTGEDDAIVTEIAGTTRDVLRKTVSFGGVTLLLSDTAGLREVRETVESIGVERAKKETENAELILAVFDGSRPLTEDEKKTAAGLPAAAKIAVINKKDLASGMTGADKKFLADQFDAAVSASAKDGDTGELEAAVSSLFDGGAVDLTRDPVIWDARRRADLSVAAELLARAEDILSSGGPADAACALCEEASGRIAMTDGRGVSEEILSEIFSRFCVGK